MHHSRTHSKVLFEVGSGLGKIPYFPEVFFSSFHCHCWWFAASPNDDLVGLTKKV